MQSKNVLITDIDNTLFDWVEFWYRSFSAMFEIIVSKSGIDRERLLDETKAIHQANGTSEYSMLIEELPCLKRKYSQSKLSYEFADAIAAYREQRKQTMHLYPTVRDTLLNIKSSGSLIIAYTDSLSYYALTRIKYLDLDGIVDYLYSPPDHPPAAAVSNYENIRTQPPERYRPQRTKHICLPPSEIKPNPRVLLDIIEKVNASREQCVYVGDSLPKDIVMAQRAEVLDVHADYGTAHERDEYELLKRVTHWTDDQVKAEKELTKSLANPTITCQVNFAEILEHVTFYKFH